MNTSLLESFVEFCKKSEVKLPYNFNILDEQCGHIVENSHTNMLMKLLQYKNQYGYIFLESFFSFMGLNIKINPNIDVKFYREKSYMGEKGKGRLDGLIYQQDKFVLIIENKVNGADNGKGQLKKYIDGVLDDKEIFADTNNKTENGLKVWVMYLTKDGDGEPDKISWERMKDLSICNNSHYVKGEIAGPRYAAINYQEHILPWLKEEIQPIVMQKEKALNTGLIQYIDFLEGMLGMRHSDIELLGGGKDWLISQLKDEELKELKELNIKDVKIINEHLDKIKKDIDKQLKGMIKGGGEDVVDYRRYAGLLNNLLEEINDEPMKDFFEITRNYFESKMKECVISHVFNYYYIQIRDVSWPRSVHFEWYPLGVKKLTNPNQKEFTFCFHVENVQIRKKFEGDNKIQEYFPSFTMEQRSRTLTFIQSFKTNTNPFLENKSKLQGFLENDVYSKVTNDMIVQINKILKED